MKVTMVYSPEGVEPKRWLFEPAKMKNAEAEEIERLTDLTFVEWQDKTIRGSVLCTRVLLWLHLRKDVPGLTLNQVEFEVGEVTWDYDFGDEIDEVESAANEVEKTPKAPKKKP